MVVARSRCTSRMLARRHRLAAARVVGHGDHDQRNAIGADAPCEAGRAARPVSMLPLNGMQGLGLSAASGIGRSIAVRAVVPRRWPASCRSGCCWGRRLPASRPGDLRTGCARQRAPGGWGSRARSRRCRAPRPRSAGSCAPRRRTRRRASRPPTARCSWRPYRCRSGGRSARPGRAAETDCRALRPGAARARRVSSCGWARRS